MEPSSVANQDTKTGYKGTGFALGLCVVWIVVTGTMGTLGFYEDVRSGLHARVLLTVVTPTLFFAGLFGLFAGVRDWTRRLSPAMMALPHAWRTVGFTFLTLWAYGILPAGFAAPAGFGDFAIGMAAPFIAIAFWMQWKGASVAAIWFHALGFLDLFIALLTGITGFGMASEQMNQIDPMTTFPLVLIPTVAVPLLIAGHVIGLLNLFMRKPVA